MSKYKANISLKNKNNVTTLIFDSVKERSRVFDVGCASGYLAELLTKEKGCTVVGLEIDPDDAVKARKYCEKVLVENVEESLWQEKLKGEKFDHIVFSDVLEHLKDPESVLRTMKNFLVGNGSILISIPNVAHVSVRLELLSGKFVPEPIGILDNTHLKYFTKETFTDLVKSAGFKVRKLAASSFDFPEAKIEQYLEKIGLRAQDKALREFSSEEAVAYQYFFEIVKSEATAQKDTKEQKPIYEVRNFLKTLENAHKKESQQLQKILRENNSLRVEIQRLNNEIETYKKSIFKVLNSKTQKTIKRFLSRSKS